MKQSSETSRHLYRELLNRGYPEAFCAVVAGELNTDFTAKRMLGYLRYFTDLPMEDIADEMLSILSDREAIISKKKKEYNQHAINELCRYGLDHYGEPHED